MHHQREKYHLLTMISLALAIIFTIVSFFKSSLFFFFFSLYLLVVSLISDALFLYLTFQSFQSIKQLIRGITLFLITTFLLLYLLRL